ncbi:MAG: CRISPR-associated endonuclease Cas2 [Prevotella sp.]|nr:CRISPR-associated endonuclease Cas2 [Prevotella sp.]MDD7046914.1 CRISPR-associated endonuclease Cas2 [Prevotella sp.]MDD7335095.1 CRISPR-associated endonuclease Cas2 [Prevotella sp.]MDY4625224.1 CRISPR-associated endonuclease Cas2 [Prevotella sp.]
MMILVTYDVDTVSLTGQKRLRKVAKACQDYGQRVQNSVFECQVNESQFAILVDRLKCIIDKTLDSIRIYRLGKNPKLHTIILGKETSYDVEGVLLV